LFIPLLFHHSVNFVFFTSKKTVDGSNISCLSQIVTIPSPCAASTFSLRLRHSE